MYRIIIVDDEKIIRNGIACVLPWKEMGIGEVYTAASGLEALEIMEAHSIDLMITDIQMAEMDGLTLVEKINETNPGMRIIVLTGYDNFEYVQKCCKMEVHDYLLKPVDEVELEDTIRKQIEAIRKNEVSARKQRVLSRAKGIEEQMKIEHAMQNLLGDKGEEIRWILEEYHIQENQPMQAAVIAPIVYDSESWSRHYELLNLSIKNTCIEMFDFNREGITFEDCKKNIVVILFNGNEFEESMQRAENLSSYLKEEYGIRQQVLLGSEVEGLEQIYISYNDACLLKNSPDENSDIRQSPKSELRLKLFYEIFHELKKSIENNMGDYEKANRALESFCQAVEAYNLSNTLMKKSCFELASGVYFSYLLTTNDGADNRLNELAVTMQGCEREDVAEITRKFVARLLRPGEEKVHEVVAQAKSYIKQHLEEEISVTQLAQHFYVTPSYFSKLFKKNTGEGCNNYIVRKRMEKAQSLLANTNMKTGKIADLCGYKDVNYFSLAFKKFSGQSPLDYREIAQKN